MSRKAKKNIFNYSVIGEYIGKNKIKRTIIIDSNGYSYDVILSRVKKHRPDFVCKTNPFSLENIGKWLIKNNKSFKLTKENKYKTAKTKLEFYCNDCKDFFNMTWDSVFSGANCAVCKGFQTGRFHGLQYLEPEIAKEIDSSNKISPSNISISSNKKLLWKCKDCGKTWWAMVNTRTNKKQRCGCPYCGGLKVSDKNRFSIFFPEIAKEWHPNKNKGVFPKDVSYGTAKKFWWSCKDCGNEWFADVHNRTSGMNGCPKCRSSKGEKEISRKLTKFKINYMFQKSFDNCRDEEILYFDFYIKKLNACIEYQGEHHFKPIRFSNSVSKEDAILKLKSQKRRDGIKIKYCKKNKIKLIIIPYWEFSNIEEILKKELIL